MQSNERSDGTIVLAMAPSMTSVSERQRAVFCHLLRLWIWLDRRLLSSSAVAPEQALTTMADSSRFHGRLEKSAESFRQFKMS